MRHSVRGSTLHALAVLLLALGMAAVPSAASDLRLMAPPDVSSPRATLTSFLDSMHDGYGLLMEAYEEHRGSPGFGTAEGVREKVHRSEFLLRRAAATLDIRHIPPANRSNASIEGAILLMEVLDRLPVPDLANVPDAADVLAAPVHRWHYPGSEIAINYIDEGPQAGSFLFSADTVARVHEFYDLVREFPQRADAAPDFFRFYAMTPGKLLPPKWAWRIEELPTWMHAPLLDQAVWQWLGLCVVILASGLLVALAWKLAAGVRALGGSYGMAHLLVPAAVMLVAFAALWLIDNVLNVTGTVFWAIEVAGLTSIYGAAAFAAYYFSICAAGWIVALPNIDPAGINASLVQVICRLLGILAGLSILVIGAHELGVPVYGVVAGLGVGGLALGLAAKPTLENLIGGLILYADRPVAVGDYCQFGEKVGTIEGIGLRSTRVRASDRSLVTVPNGDFSNREIVNFTRRDRTLLKSRIGLRHDTEAEKLRLVLDRIRVLLHAHPDLVPETARTRLVMLGSHALEIEFQANVTTADWNEFLRVQEDVLLGVLDIVETSGVTVALASPTITIAASAALPQDLPRSRSPIDEAAAAGLPAYLDPRPAASTGAAASGSARAAT